MIGFHQSLKYARLLVVDPKWNFHGNRAGIVLEHVNLNLFMTFCKTVRVHLQPLRGVFATKMSFQLIVDRYWTGMDA